jgi:hypothetical protein
VSSGGAPANDGSFDPVISADGRFVAFYSSASNLVAGDTNGMPDVFLRARSFIDGDARCAWQIPTGARAKQLKGSLTATTAYGTVRRHFAGIVRAAS